MHDVQERLSEIRIIQIDLPEGRVSCKLNATELRENKTVRTITKMLS